MKERTFQDICRDLYIYLLKQIAVDDPQLEEVLKEISLAAILEKKNSIFTAEELVACGGPLQRHLEPTVSRKLLVEINDTLRTISTLLPNGQEGDGIPNLYEVPNVLQGMLKEVVTMAQERTDREESIRSLVEEINETQHKYDNAVKTAVLDVLPAYNESRTASVELIAANIEASLQRLSLIRGQSQRSFYNHQATIPSGEPRTVAQAITNAYSSLKDGEKRLKAEEEDLDRQLEEYEILLKLVDSGSGGYQEVVEDWAKTKRETDECRKDLRRFVGNSADRVSALI